MKLLLDTCVLSEIRKTDGSPAVKGFIEAMPASGLYLSIITVGEIAKGIAFLPDGQKKRELTAWGMGFPASLRTASFRWIRNRRRYGASSQPPGNKRGQ